MLSQAFSGWLLNSDNRTPPENAEMLQVIIETMQMDYVKAQA